MKKAIIATVAGLLASVIIIVVATAIITAIFIQVGKEKSDEEQAVEASQLEHFTITGTKSGENYKLKFQFKDWSIKNIEFPVTGSSGTNSIQVKMPGYSGSREDMAYQCFRQHGLTPEAACGIMGNIRVESANTWKSTIEEGHGGYRGKDVLWKGYGIFQWTNTQSGSNYSWRRRNVINYLEGKGLDVENDNDKAFVAELEYALDEYPSVYNKIKNCTDVNEATKIWCVDWERPADMYSQATYRAQYSREYLDKYKNTSVRGGTGKKDAVLAVRYTVENGEVIFNGTLDGIEIAGTFKAENGSVTGDGEYGVGAMAFASSGAVKNPYGDSKFTIMSLALVWRICPFHGREIHSGWDFVGPPEIYAVLPGRVVTAGSVAGYGSHAVIIESRGKIFTLYGHMSAMMVNEGDTVRAGQRVGTQGNEGNSNGTHLHLEFRKGSENGAAFANLKQVKPMLQKYASNYSSVSSDFSNITNK